MEHMTSFEIAVSVLGTLATIIGVIATIFINRLLDTLKTMGADVNGIRVEMGRIATTQVSHSEKFNQHDKRIEKLEDRALSAWVEDDDKK